MTACWALVGNRKGHLTSYDRKTTFNKQPDDILPAGQYFYFLDDFPSTKNYAICTEFRRWPFPDAVPAAWDTVPSAPQLATSDAVRGRDRCCTMSGEKYSLTSAPVVPFAENDWVFANRQKLQLSGPVCHRDPANFITLTAGVHVPQFDEGVWVPVPKCGQYRVHFLRTDPVLADRYHNIIFTGSRVTSGRLLLSRFVWSCCKNLQTSGFHLRFRSFDGDDDGDDEDHDGGTKKGKGKRKRKRKDSGGTKKRPRGPNKGDDNEEYQPRVTKVAHDDQDDEMTLNDEELSSLNDPWNLAAFAGHNPLSEEYPGQAEVERREAEYINANPQIRQYSDQVLRSNLFHESMWDPE